MADAMSPMAELRVLCDAYLNARLHTTELPRMRTLSVELDGRVPDAAFELLERRDVVFGVRRKQGKAAQREAVEALLEAWHKLAEALGMTEEEPVVQQMALEA